MNATIHNLAPKSKKQEQFTTFYIRGELFGVDISKVQEVTRHPTVYSVPLAPPYVRGLVNLRGQIATALGLREIFGLQGSDEIEVPMSVVSRIDGNLVALIVDGIGDVVEVDASRFEQTPDTIAEGVRHYLKGVYKLNGSLLSILDMDAIAKELSPLDEGAPVRNANT